MVENRSRESEPAIRIRNLSKEYRLGQIGGGTLQKDLQSWWAAKRGKEDPNRRIGAQKRLSGDRFMALRDINLSVDRGEALGIIGSNGAGKSTLLKIISRVTAPTAGSVELFGRVTSMLEVGTGFHGEMTGRENIYMNGSILGMSRAEIRERMDDIIAFSEMAEFMDTPVKRYSSGMYVKLAFSVAAHLRSDIMIMDEVLAVGDASFQQKCLNAMSYASESENRTVLYVSHNMETIRKLCRRCIVLSEGRLIYDGKTEDAIRVYMESGFSEQIEVNYWGQDFATWIDAPGVHLISASYCGKESNGFLYGEKMRLLLTWENLRKLDKISLRLEVRSITEQPVATYVMYEFYSGPAGKKETLEAELDISMFPEGEYYMYYTFFEDSHVAGQIHLECRKGLCFRILSSGHSGRLAWEPDKWGYVQMDVGEWRMV